MNKRSLILYTLIIFNLSINPVIAGPFDLLNQGNSSSSVKEVNLNSLSYNASRLIMRVGKATIAFAESSTTMYEAIGEKEKAEKLRALVDEVKKKQNDEESIKKFVENKEVNQAFEDLGNIDLNSKKQMVVSVEQLVTAFGQLGGGINLDTKAVEDAKSLTTEATGLVDLVKSNPLKYGFSAFTTVNSVLSSGKFIVDNVPNQIVNIQSFSEKLIQYFKTNNIPIPSPDKLQKIADEMEKG
ncbi:MAG: hypothetical protein ACK4IX_01770 [Candidatus Sericytochromatia bacterium]